MRTFSDRDICTTLHGVKLTSSRPIHPSTGLIVEAIGDVRWVQDWGMLMGTPSPPWSWASCLPMNLLNPQAISIQPAHAQIFWDSTFPDPHESAIRRQHAQSWAFQWNINLWECEAMSFKSINIPKRERERVREREEREWERESSWPIGFPGKRKSV